MDRSGRVRTPGNRSPRRLRPNHRTGPHRRLGGPQLPQGPLRRPGTGNPTDRAELGIEWPLMTDRNGIPLASVINSDRRHDNILFGPALRAAQERGLLPDAGPCTWTAATTAQPFSTNAAATESPTWYAPRNDHALKPNKPGADAPRDALDRGTHQLMAVQLRAAPPQHRPPAAAPPSSTPPRDHPAHHRQTHRLAQPMEPQTLTYSLGVQLASKSLRRPGTGKNSTDRAKLGIEWPLMTDRNGIPAAR